MKRLFQLLFSLLIIYNCGNTKHASFENYIYTTDKLINEQKKQTFYSEDQKVFVSNEFSGARINDFEKINDSTVRVTINPENEPINNSAYYAFKIWSKSPKTYYINFDYPEEYNHRYVPKIYKNNSWTILDSVNIIEQNDKTSIKLNLNNSPQIVAAQQIEDYNSVISWGKTLDAKNSNLVHFDYYGESSEKRNLPILKLNNGETKNKDVIVLLTRQHPPEVTGYYAFQHFINSLIKENNLSKQFFDKYQILAFPILNPDGVEKGHWRHNANGVDTNRDWSKYNQKEIKQTVKYINKYVKKNNSRVIIGLDFHSTWYDVFYTNKERANTTLPNFVSDWFKGIEANYPNYKVKEASGNSLKPVSKGWFLKAHNAVGITFEIGDKTPKENIELIGNIAATQMMELLLDTKN